MARMLGRSKVAKTCVYGCCTEWGHRSADKRKAVRTNRSRETRIWQQEEAA